LKALEAKDEKAARKLGSRHVRNAAAVAIGLLRKTQEDGDIKKKA
jgi:hypothetical protein